MSTIIGWLLPLVGAALGNALTRFFEGACPLAAQTLVCQHWEGIATIAGTVLGAVGFKVVRQQQASRRAAQRPVLQVVPPTEPPPSVLVTEVDVQDVVDDPLSRQ